jgi:hypothetical protein
MSGCVEDMLLEGTITGAGDGPEIVGAAAAGASAGVVSGTASDRVVGPVSDTKHWVHHAAWSTLRARHDGHLTG